MSTPSARPEEVRRIAGNVGSAILNNDDPVLVLSPTKASSGAEELLYRCSWLVVVVVLARRGGVLGEHVLCVVVSGVMVAKSDETKTIDINNLVL